MAAPTLITVDNYATLLVESTQGRAGAPDGNIFFDQANDRIELITVEELAQVDLGSGAEDNPLANLEGITLQALYAFERLRRGANTALRNYLPGTDGVFQDAGAFSFDNGVKLADNDRVKVRGSGWTEFAAGGATDRIYFGVRSLNAIESTSQPFVQIAASLSETDLQAAAPIDAARLGPLDEAFQVFGSTANGDAGAGDFDFTSRVLVAKVRTYGQTQGEATSTGSGVGRLRAFSAGFGIGENPSPSGDFTEADVFGGAAVAPFATMAFERFGAPQAQAGFNQGSLDFTDVIANPAGGSLAQVRAYMDAIMKEDTDQDAGAGTFLPKRADPLYTIDTDGRLVTRQGLYIANLPASDLQSIVQTSDNATAGTYPFEPEIRISVSDAWFNDANSWAQVMYVDGAGADDFETASAVIVQDSTNTDMVFTPADAMGAAGNYFISKPYAYDTNTQAGLTAGVDKAAVVLAEGNGGAQAASAFFTITRTTTISVTTNSEVETNI